MSHRIATLILLFTVLFAFTACTGIGPEPRAETARGETLPYAVNINTASVDELQAIPHVGESMAKKIIEHRETNGPFRRPEHLMLISGVSDERFRKIRPLIRVE